MDAEAELAKLKVLHPTATLVREGGSPAALLPGFSFKSNGAFVTMNLLLAPFQHSGYPTRLFFERQVVGKASNWNRFTVIGHTWWAPSWTGVAATLPWTSILCAHLRAVA